MAQSRELNNPPIQEAVMQFEFAGPSLTADQLESLAGSYVGEGWESQAVHQHELRATLGEGQETAAATVTTNSAFIGFVVSDKTKTQLLHLRPNILAVSNVRPYQSWEKLTACARTAFNRFVDAAHPEAVTKISARFINRISPIPGKSSFSEILERPPLPLEGLQGAVISDFLRRHVVTELKGGFTANLTIGTVVPDAGEDPAGKALVIDTDVFKYCQLEPCFSHLTADLALLREIKNILFFGSLKNAIVEAFQ